MGRNRKLESYFEDWTDMKAGEFFYTSYGDYSDFGLGQFYRVLKDANIAAAIADFREVGKFKNGIDNFLKFLSARGVVDEVQTRELWTSSY